MWEWDKYFLHDFSLCITANAVLLQDISWTKSCTINSLNLKRPGKRCSQSLAHDTKLRWAVTWSSWGLGLLGEELGEEFGTSVLVWSLTWNWEPLLCHPAVSHSRSHGSHCSCEVLTFFIIWKRPDLLTTSPGGSYCVSLLDERDWWCWLLRVIRILKGQAKRRRAVANEAGLHLILDCRSLPRLKIAGA